MSKESDRYELQALKDGFDLLTREAPPCDIPIAFNDQSRRRVGDLISQAATNNNGVEKLGPSPVLGQTDEAGVPRFGCERDPVLGKKPP